MSASHSARDHSDHVGHDQDQPAAGHSSRHQWMMLACCVPMLVIAIALVASRTVGVGFLLVAVACAAMMALMMRGMGHGGRH